MYPDLFVRCGPREDRRTADDAVIRLEVPLAEIHEESEVMTAAAIG
jgi:hypothetical protein